MGFLYIVIHATAQMAHHLHHLHGWEIWHVHGRLWDVAKPIRLHVRP